MLVTARERSLASKAGSGSKVGSGGSMPYSDKGQSVEGGGRREVPASGALSTGLCCCKGGEGESRVFGTTWAAGRTPATLALAGLVPLSTTLPPSP
jgi:hypothetical protein